MRNSAFTPNTSGVRSACAAVAIRIIVAHVAICVLIDFERNFVVQRSSNLPSGVVRVRVSAVRRNVGNLKTVVVDEPAGRMDFFHSVKVVPRGGENYGEGKVPEDDCAVSEELNLRRERISLRNFIDDAVFGNVVEVDDDAVTGAHVRCEVRLVGIAW